VNDETREKVAKLPTWARELIDRLEKQFKEANEEPTRLRRKISHLEGQIRKLQERIDGMEAILTCAARGGHETAQAYVERIMNEYSSGP